MPNFSGIIFLPFLLAVSLMLSNTPAAFTKTRTVSSRLKDKDKAGRGRKCLRFLKSCVFFIVDSPFGVS